MGFLGGLGKILGSVASVAQLIPGVGTLAGGALGGVGGLLRGEGLKGALGGAISGAIPGVGGLAGKLLGAAPGIIGALGAAHGANQMDQGNALMNQATQQKMKQYGALQPVRDRAISQALAGAPRAPNLYGVFNDPTNPFSRANASPNQGPPPGPMPPPPPIPGLPPGMPPGGMQRPPGMTGGPPPGGFGFPLGGQGFPPRGGLAGRLLR